MSVTVDTALNANLVNINTACAHTLLCRIPYMSNCDLLDLFCESKSNASNTIDDVRILLLEVIAAIGAILPNATVEDVAALTKAVAPIVAKGAKAVQES